VPWPDWTPANVLGAFFPRLHRLWSRRHRAEGS